MTTAEAKEMIGAELMNGYRAWLDDERNLTGSEYGKKYGWGKAQEPHNDSFKSLGVYMNYIFNGRYLPGWVKAGYDKNVIYDLHHEGFLSYKGYYNWEARMTGRTELYYIPQKTAREIWKKAKQG